jgi:NADH:ubiquinone oxidoreductase subunit E
MQHMAKAYEDAATGRYRYQINPAASEASEAAGHQQQQVQAELAKAVDRQSRLLEVLQQLQKQAPSLHAELDRVMAHAVAASSWLNSRGALASH